MGMHHGMIAAVGGADRLVAVMDAHNPGIAPGQRRGSIDDLLDDDDDGWHMAFGERSGRSYILDSSLVVSSEGDAIVAASAELGGLVVGCGAETTSGSFWFYAADHGRLLRGYMNCHTDMSEPWSKGEPLASEAAQPLEDLDGAGFIAALESLGFDYNAWADGTDLRELIYNPSAEAQAEAGGLSAELEAFRRTVEIPKGKQPKPEVVRRDGGYNLATTAPSEKQKGGLFGFLRRG